MLPRAGADGMAERYIVGCSAEQCTAVYTPRGGYLTDQALVVLEQQGLLQWRADRSIASEKGVEPSHLLINSQLFEYL